MTDRPLIFSAESIHAMLEDPPRKWMTRRIVNRERGLRVRLPEPVDSELSVFAPTVTAPAGIHRARLNPHGAVFIELNGKPFGIKPGEFEWVAPYSVGGRIWVKETWRTYERPEDCADGALYPDGAFQIIEDTMDAATAWVVAHDNGKYRESWRPSMFMPRWASRIDLEVTALRLERVQDISGEDAIAEGIGEPVGTALAHGSVTDKWNLRAFAIAWDRLSGRRASWDSNPLVWVIEFRRVRPARADMETAA